MRGSSSASVPRSLGNYAVRSGRLDIGRLDPRNLAFAQGSRVFFIPLIFSRFCGRIRAGFRAYPESLFINDENEEILRFALPTGQAGQNDNII